ncbi:hypothetical protein BAY60_10290 [Prauserella muralis]|uniref:Uncharacterized protein n=1 Tax=Prauserella muralis TaxID=588067 RepID=A0A2V4BAY3_9PSEU|nr:P-loop NTPase [Prauserella muralis]PXY26889.1 hypothetical protein BAY60_10290 [Prauserella muralis]
MTTPQPSAQTVASRAGRMARDMRMPIAGVVENMSALACAGCGERTALFGAGGGRLLADELGTELLGRSRSTPRCARRVTPAFPWWCAIAAPPPPSP